MEIGESSRQNREMSLATDFPPVTPARTPLKTNKRKKGFRARGFRRRRRQVHRGHHGNAPSVTQANRRRVRSPDWRRGRRHAQKGACQPGMRRFEGRSLARMRRHDASAQKESDPGHQAERTCRSERGVLSPSERCVLSPSERCVLSPSERGVLSPRRERTCRERAPRVVPRKESRIRTRRREDVPREGSSCCVREKGVWV